MRTKDHEPMREADQDENGHSDKRSVETFMELNRQPNSCSSKVQWKAFSRYYCIGLRRGGGG